MLALGEPRQKHMVTLSVVSLKLFRVSQIISKQTFFKLVCLEEEGGEDHTVPPPIPEGQASGLERRSYLRKLNVEMFHAGCWDRSCFGVW